jgi:hypothetical protein
MADVPVLVFVSAKTCGACQSFKPYWDKHRHEIDKRKDIRLMDNIEVPDLKDMPRTDLYPSDLQRYIRWFPFFGLFTQQSWDVSMPGSTLEGEKKLVGSVFSGNMIDGFATPLDNPEPPLVENLNRWLDKELASPLFSQPQSESNYSISPPQTDNYVGSYVPTMGFCRNFKLRPRKK